MKTLQPVGHVSPVSAWLGPWARVPCLESESLSLSPCQSGASGYRGVTPQGEGPVGRRPGMTFALRGGGREAEAFGSCFQAT